MPAFPERCDPRRTLEISEGAAELLAIDPSGVPTLSLDCLPKTYKMKSQVKKFLRCNKVRFLIPSTRIHIKLFHTIISKCSIKSIFVARKRSISLIVTDLVTLGIVYLKVTSSCSTG